MDLDVTFKRSLVARNGSLLAKFLGGPVDIVRPLPAERPKSANSHVNLLFELADQSLLHGRAEGLQDGQRDLLLQMIEAKFGSLAGTVRHRIEGAGPEEIRIWSTRLLRCSSLDEIFG